MFAPGDFALVDAATFEAFMMPADDAAEIPDNYCPNCSIPMEIAGSEYKCADCGFTDTKEEIVETDKSNTRNAVIKISTGAKRGRHYNVSSDYSRTQRQALTEQLMYRHAVSTALNIPINIIQAVVGEYNKIQQSICEVVVMEDGTRVNKKFVRRGNPKDEVLAALIYFECTREGLMRKKKDIAEFMGLKTGGFSRGENILRDLEAIGIITLPKTIEPARRLAERYIEALNLENPAYVEFVVDIVNESEAHKICMTSLLSSKVVGAIWLLICGLKLKIPCSALEKAADNIKKNTFLKFSTTVLSALHIFKPIFDDHQIPF